MAIPNPPTRPPTRGNSQMVPHDAVQQQNRPREVHPAVTEFHERYARIWEDNDSLRNDNDRLIKENEVLRKLDAEKSALIESLRMGIAEAQKVTDQRLGAQEAHYRERVAESERAKEKYLRYAVSISTDIKACITNLEAADQTAMEMAQSPSSKVLEDVQKSIAEVTHALDK